MIYTFQATRPGGAVETVEVRAVDYEHALERLYFDKHFGVVDRSVLVGQRRRTKPAAQKKRPRKVGVTHA